jgi:hypothetical protein
MFVCELLGSFVTVAQAEPNAKRWRRSRDRGLPVLWLATAQNLTLTAEGRAAYWLFAAARSFSYWSYCWLLMRDLQSWYAAGGWFAHEFCAFILTPSYHACVVQPYCMDEVMAIKAIDANFEKESFTAFLLSSADVSDLVRCICFLLRLFCFQSLSLMRPNAQVNRQKCEAFLSALNLQLGWWQMRGWTSPTHT